MKQSRLTEIETRLTKLEIELFKNQDNYMKEGHKSDLEIAKIVVNTPTSNFGKMIAIRDIIYKITETGIKKISIKEVVAETIKIGMKEEEVKTLIEKLRLTGDIFQPKPGYVQII